MTPGRKATKEEARRFVALMREHYPLAQVIHPELVFETLDTMLPQGRLFTEAAKALWNLVAPLVGGMTYAQFLERPSCLGLLIFLPEWCWDDPDALIAVATHEFRHHARWLEDPVHVGWLYASRWVEREIEEARCCTAEYEVSWARFREVRTIRQIADPLLEGGYRIPAAGKESLEALLDQAATEASRVAPGDTVALRAIAALRAIDPALLASD